MSTLGPQPETRSLVGAVLSRRYRLVQRLGEGGMGEVYAAEVIEGGGRVAVKILHPEFVGEVHVLSRFLDEATTCQRLIHPNIVRVFESLTAEDGSPYLVMELLEGVPLSAYTSNGGRIPPAQAVPILQGILAGLAAAHAQGIVHRDLKPENVFLTRDDKGHFVVKVLDFGIAKVMDVAGGMGSKTRTGMLLGTPAYMSPEQIRNAKDVDARADLWSAGVMFYEMVTGRSAFPAPTEYARLTAVISSNPEPIEQVDPTLLPLSPFVRRAMAKDRGERFQSALEMSRALTGLLGVGLDQTAPAPPTGQMAAVGVPSRALEPQALSRLPEVNSIFRPVLPQYSQGVPTAPAHAIGPAPPPPTEVTGPPLPATKAPGGTLASPSQPVGIASQPPPPAVVVVTHPSAPPPIGGTLPSQDLPMLQRKSASAPAQGIAAGLVVALVLGALVAGFLIGFAVGRMS